LVEQGSTIAASVYKWGHVNLFSTNALNCSKWGLAAVAEAGFGRANAIDLSRCPNGREYADTYLTQLHTYLQQQPDGVVELRLNTRVEALSKSGVIKNEQVRAVGEMKREHASFNALLVSTQDTDAETYRTDFAAVMDCSGSFGNGAGVGAGGAPALGERYLRRTCSGAVGVAAEEEEAGQLPPPLQTCWFDALPDVCGRDRRALLGKQHAGKRAIVLVGGMPPPPPPS
jgi:hypothetical protein